MSASDVVDVTDETWDQEVTLCELPVLIDFWGEGCAPCQILAPTIAQLAVHYQGRVKVVKADVYAARKAAVRYRVHAVPTLLILKQGQPVETLVGAQSLARLAACLDRHLASSGVSANSQ